MKNKIKNLYVKSINDDVAPNVFADKILLLFGTLPPKSDWIYPKDKFPENGETVMTLTNFDNQIAARFELFLGNQIWESYKDTDTNEIVVGWKKI